MPCFRICAKDKPHPGPSTDYNKMGRLRKWWEDFDLKILLLYILFTQLYLHFFGRLRRKSTSAFLMIVNVWLLYLFSDLLATIALGKLSKIKGPDDGAWNFTSLTNATSNPKNNATGNPKNESENSALRVMWAPLILFYLGGPDTLTVLRFEENHLWVRHFIGLLTQGLRTAYVLIASWDPPTMWLSLAAILMLIPGIIKYGERVLVVWSNSNDSYPGFMESASNEADRFRPVRSNSELVLQAYSWFQALMPHCQDYICDKSRVRTLVTKFRESVRTSSSDPFPLMEIELGFIYDRVFSKVGTIFTVWGSILRLLSFSMIVSVLVAFLVLEDKLPKDLWKGDKEITIVLLAGAILLDLAGIVAQLASDWALVWAADRKSTPKWATDTVLFLHENLMPKSRQRWSGAMGQFSLREFYTNYKPPVCNKPREYLFGREKMLKRYSSPQKSLVHSSQNSLVQHFKNLVIDGIRDMTEKAIVVDASAETSNDKVATIDKFQTWGVSRGEWTLERYKPVHQFKWTVVKLEFGRSIVLWHAATELCYKSDQGDNGMTSEEAVKMKREAVKVLSDYMMYLLVVCPHRFPFCIKYDKVTDDYADKKKLFDGGESVPPRKEGVENESNTVDMKLMNEAQSLAQVMTKEFDAERWDIMASMWVEMMCYAAWKCPVKNHIQELRHGGEFLTHVWLLLMHFGVPKGLESKSSRKDEYDSAVKSSFGALGELEDNVVEENQYAIEATRWDIGNL